jgi:hypothetical protein
MGHGFLYYPPFFFLNFEKGMIYMKILKKRGGSREKGGGGNEIHAPCACGRHMQFDVNIRLYEY